MINAIRIMLFEGDVGANCPNFRESFFEMQVKMQVKKGEKQGGQPELAQDFLR